MNSKFSSDLYPIGILVALPQELKTVIKKKLALAQPYQLSDQIWIIRSGMGPAYAREATHLLMEKGVKFLISWGTAGALHPSLQAGNLVLPHQVIGGENLETYLPNLSFNEDIYRLFSDKIAIHRKALWSRGSLITDSLEKENLYKNHEAIAIDMESGALAEVATKHQIPFGVIRSIVDTVDMKFPKVVSIATKDTGEIDFIKFIPYLLSHPSDWPLLFHLAKAFGKAEQTLKSISKDLIQ